jgi:hypothetical protein
MQIRREGPGPKELGRSGSYNPPTRAIMVKNEMKSVAILSFYVLFFQMSTKLLALKYLLTNPQQNNKVIN